jgi:Leucine-rich repeat (LRR) protein
MKSLLVALCVTLGISFAGRLSPVVAEQPASHTPQEVAAAKKLAIQLGGRLKEDRQGNVISIDMAAGRAWADDNQMEQILVFPKLATLVLEGPGITNQLTARIAEQRNLVSLTLKNTLVDDEGIAQLADLKSLRIIELPVAPLVSDRSMEVLVKLPQLRAVRLVGGNVTDRGVATLLRAPQLRELDVRNCRNVTNAAIEQIAQKPTLRVLKIGGPAIDDRSLAIVGRMKNLVGLGIEGGNLSDAGLGKLASLGLEDLALHNCAQVTDRGLDVLANYGSLRQLTLQGVAAKGAAIQKLPHPERLTSLSLAQSGVTDAELAGIARLTHLETLNLSQTAVSDKAIAVLSKLASLKRLTIAQTRVSDEGAERLRKALPHCTVR